MSEQDQHTIELDDYEAEIMVKALDLAQRVTSISLGEKFAMLSLKEKLEEIMMEKGDE